MVMAIGVTRRLCAREKLDNLLLKVVDETLKQVFREEGSRVIYDFLGNNCHLTREEVVEKPEVFSTGLKKVLGSGAPVIEKLILKKLYQKLRLEYEEKEGDEFSNYVKELRRRCGC